MIEPIDPSRAEPVADGRAGTTFGPEERAAVAAQSAIAAPTVPRFRELLPSLLRALGRFALAALVPVLTFYVAFRLGGPVVGIACGMALSLTALLIQLRRLGRLDPIVLVPMGLILVQGGLALAFGSVDLYLAAPIVENTLWGIVLVGSVVLKRPLVRVIAGELGLIPVQFVGSPMLARALDTVTVAWGVGAFVKAGVRLWLLSMLTLEPFLAAITLFHFALNGSLLAFSFWWPLRAARRAGATSSGAASSG